MALISYGQHSHPPPPPRKIPATVKEAFTKVFQNFGLAEVTARRLLASPMLPILLDGKTSLSSHHISLANMDAVNHLIRKERMREHPNGTNILGVQHLLSKQVSNPYIRQATQFDDGHFIVLCQFPQQSHSIFEVFEIQADKTFRRNQCREFEINAFNPSTNRIITISRVWTDYEDENGYYQAFRLVFETAEKDVGKQICWGHLTKTLSEPYIKAVIVDEHGGQMKGLGKYLNWQYPEYTIEEHISKIVKVCQTHYFRSITKLAQKGVPKSSSLRKIMLNCIDICEILKGLPGHLTMESLHAAVGIVRNETEKPGAPKALINWLKHKDANPWVLVCLCYPMSSMRMTDWVATSFTTNIAESAHALSQRYGKQLTLVGAIQAGEKLDRQHYEIARIGYQIGLNTTYGNRSVTGRAHKSAIRQRSRTEASKKTKKHETTEKILMEARSLLDAGISKDIVENF